MKMKLIVIALIAIIALEGYALIHQHQQLNEMESNIIYSSSVITDSLEMMTNQQMEISEAEENDVPSLKGVNESGRAFLLNHVVSFKVLVESIDDEIAYSPVMENIFDVTSKFNTATTQEEVQEATSELEEVIQKHKEFSQTVMDEYL